MSFPKPRFLDLTARQTRDYGSIQQTFEVKATFEITKTLDRQQAFKALNVLIEQEFSAFETGFLKDVDASEPESHPYDDPILVYRKEGNREFFRMKCGKWMEWGVPIYPEVLPETLAKEAEREGEITLKDYRCTVEVEDGKAKRVSSLWRTR